MTSSTDAHLYIYTVTTAFGDCLESIPPTVTRNISDLRELDAVLSGSLSSITAKLNALLVSLESAPTSATEGNGTTTKNSAAQRLLMLREIAEEARSFRLGGEDKIRVATGTCETVSITPSLSVSTIYSHGLI